MLIKHIITNIQKPDSFNISINDSIEFLLYKIEQIDKIDKSNILVSTNYGSTEIDLSSMIILYIPNPYYSEDEIKIELKFENGNIQIYSAKITINDYINKSKLKQNIQNVSNKTKNKKNNYPIIVKNNKNSTTVQIDNSYVNRNQKKSKNNINHESCLKIEVQSNTEELNIKTWYDETDFPSSNPLNIFNIAKKLRPKDLLEPIFWDKEKHNYKIKFYQATNLIYKNLWTGRYNLRDIKVDVKNNIMYLKISAPFIEYIKRIYPNALN